MTPSLRLRGAPALGLLFGANLWPLFAHPQWAPAWLTVTIAMLSIGLALRTGGGENA